MIKKKQKNAAQKPRAAVLTPVDIARVVGGDGDGTKIRETLTGG